MKETSISRDNLKGEKIASRNASIKVDGRKLKRLEAYGTMIRL